MSTRLAACIGLCLLVAAPTLALTPCTTLVVPAAARGPGAGTSMWQMDLYLINNGTSAARAELYWLERDTDNRGVSPVTITVPAGQTVVLTDVIRSRFNRDAAGGAIRIESDAPIAATSRIYNLQGGVTFGQGFDGLSTADATTACSQAAVVGGLRQDSGSRSNLFAVAGEAGASFRVEARTPSGAALGSASFTTPPWGAVYIPLANVAGANAGPIMTVISVDSGAAWLAGSRIDEASGDPFTLAAVVPDPSLLDLTELSGTYVGIWGLDDEDVSGTAMMFIAVAEATGTASMMLDFSGPLLNGIDPGPATVSGPLGPGSGTFYGLSPEFGSMGSTVDAHGQLDWTATGGSVPSILTIDATGFITMDQVLMSFTITLADGVSVLRGGMALVRLE